MAERGGPVGQGIVVRDYKGSLSDATGAFREDAEHMARSGYFPVSQIYQPGSYGCGAFLIALVLFVVLIGILVFLYMLLVKPPGSLVVTYQWRPTGEVAPPAPMPAVEVGNGPAGGSDPGGSRMGSYVAIAVALIVVIAFLAMYGQRWG